MNPFYIWLDDLRNKSRQEQELKQKQLNNDQTNCISCNLEACKQKLNSTQELEDEIEKLLEQENEDTSSL